MADGDADNNGILKRILDNIKRVIIDRPRALNQGPLTMENLDKLIDTEIHYLPFKDFESKLFSFRETLTNDMIAFLESQIPKIFDPFDRGNINKNINRLKGANNTDRNLTALPNSQFFLEFIGIYLKYKILTLLN